MSSKDPIFPMSGEQQQHQHHFSDYGFDPQIDYLQGLWGEALRSSSGAGGGGCRQSKPRPLDALRLKPQKPICKEGGRSKKRSKCWWKGILQFWKWRRGGKRDDHCRGLPERTGTAARHGGASLGPVYLVESSLPSRGACRRKAAGSGGRPVVARMTEVPYLNLRELNAMDGERSISGSHASSPLPIYLVT